MGQEQQDIQNEIAEISDYYNCSFGNAEFISPAVEYIMSILSGSRGLIVNALAELEMKLDVIKYMMNCSDEVNAAREKKIHDEYQFTQDIGPGYKWWH